MAKVEVHIVPDAIFGLRLERPEKPALQSHVFLEVDRGSMTIAPNAHVREGEGFLYRATILRKLMAYAESWRRELHREQFNIPAARVLFITTTLARAEAMRAAAETHILNRWNIPPGLFLFGTHSAFNRPLDIEFVSVAGNSTKILPYSDNIKV